jgi:hypothetical protein
MAEMGKYCKAYRVQRLLEFGGWAEHAQKFRTEKRRVEGEEREVQRELTAEDYLYLQENFTVTDGIFLGHKVIFSEVTPEWISFCQNVLQFKIASDKPAQDL